MIQLHGILSSLLFNLRAAYEKLKYLHKRDYIAAFPSMRKK
jgi:hypothetical protein